MNSVAKLNQSRWIKYLLWDCGQIEIRHQSQERYFKAGIFADEDLILELFDQYPTGNLYSTINKFKTRKTTNRISQQPKGSMIGNGDVIEIRRLFFDFDPVRDNGPSTNSQLEDATARARDFRRDMKGRGWPSPAICMSGNGAHLMYRCCLRADATKYLKRLYRVLADEYSDPLVTFDTKVFNAGRITRLYGSVNRKGTPTENLPHRTSEIEVPSFYECVSKNDVWAFIQEKGADQEKPKTQGNVSRIIRPTGAGDYNTLDVVGWMRSCGIYHSEKEAGQHRIYCPWKGEHSTDDGSPSAMVFENAGKWPGFHCFHDHCDGRGIFDLINLLGGADDFCRKEFSYKANG